MADITSRLAGLNPFNSDNKLDDDDKGDVMAPAAGSSRRSDTAKDQLRVSRALRTFLQENKILSERDAGLDDKELTPALRELLARRSFEAPPSLIDPRYPLPEYFVSSSHNTYLLANQLYGKSSPSAYETALTTGSRCVEIDAWDNSDNEDEPKVTHGFTLVSHILFRAVCETIRDVYDREVATGSFTAGQAGDPASPILLSLENHCGPHGQLRLVQIMREVFGHRLISEPVRRKGTREQQGSGEHVTLEDLGPKISVIVEFHLPDEETDSNNSGEDAAGDDDEEEQQRVARKAYNEKKKQSSSTIIIPELAELGVYAQSVKPKDNSWYDPGQLINGPHHHLINVSESGLSKHLPANAVLISRHNSRHLMRVFPKGTRISSTNLHPEKYWGVGAQICALNWQTYTTSVQLNDALFNGTPGYVLKPPTLRAGGSGDLRTGRSKRLRVHVAGATDVPLHEDRERDSIKPYLTCSLYSPLINKEPPKRKTEPYKHHTLGFLHHGENPHATNPIWDETLEWEYEDNELVFLRMLIKSDDSFARNPKFAVATVRLSYAPVGWTFIRMNDLKGKESDCTLLVKFDFENV